MRKYGNDNFEKKLNEDGTVLVSNVPITDEMEKEAAAVINNSKDAMKKKDQEIINEKDRLPKED